MGGVSDIAGQVADLNLDCPCTAGKTVRGDIPCIAGLDNGGAGQNQRRCVARVSLSPGQSEVNDLPGRSTGGSSDRRGLVGCVDNGAAVNRQDRQRRGDPQSLGGRASVADGVGDSRNDGVVTVGQRTIEFQGPFATDGDRLVRLGDAINGDCDLCGTRDTRDLRVGNTVGERVRVSGAAVDRDARRPRVQGAVTHRNIARLGQQATVHEAVGASVDGATSQRCAHERCVGTD